jgi:hypothetical protein
MTGFNYPWLIQEALRAMVRQVLVQTAEEGLPAPHHFYFSFATDAPGVEVPQVLRDTYPAEMTIVMEHQFWDLEVDEEAFSVTLAFAGVHHRLTIPFAALTVFADPAADIALRFQPLESFEEAADAPGDDEAEPAEPHDEKGGGEVVRLDRFRSSKTNGRE